MRLRDRLVLLIAIASLGPLALVGVGATQVSSRLMVLEVAALQARTAGALATDVDTWLSSRLDILRGQVGAFELGQLDAQVAEGFTRLVYQQTRAAQIVALVDKDGVDVVPGVFLGPGDAPVAGRTQVTQAHYEAFRSRAPISALTAALAGRTGAVLAVGKPYLPPSQSIPALPLALGSASSPDRLVLVELSLGQVAERIAASSGTDVAVTLMDERGSPVLGGEHRLVDLSVMTPFLGVAAQEIRFVTEAGGDVVAATAPVTSAGWTVVVAEPLAKSLAASRQIRARTLYIAFVAAVLSVVLGSLFARQVAVPVVRLRDAALAVAEGDLGRRVEPSGKDELGELGRAFNFMSRRLAQNRKEIDAKNDEIEAFNRELQQRVEERTAELRDAQSQLVDSARLAAVGEMGAGLAHELNNPLAGILGLAQLLRVRTSGSPDETFVASIEEQARRCTEIVAHLLRFSRDEGEAPPVDRDEWDVVDLDEVVGEVLALVGSPLRQRGVRVSHHRSQDLRVRGQRGELGRAFAQLLTRVRSAAGDGSALHIGGACRDGVVTIQLELDAVRPGSRDDWMASGMGVWAARQVFTAHGGELIEPRAADAGQAAGDQAPEAQAADAATPSTSASWRVVLPEA